MQLPRVSFQAFMTVCSKNSVLHWQCRADRVGLISHNRGLVHLIFFFSRVCSMQPLHSLLAMVNHCSYCASEMERGRATVSYARWKFLLFEDVTM